VTFLKIYLQQLKRRERLHQIHELLFAHRLQLVRLDPRRHVVNVQSYDNTTPRVQTTRYSMPDGLLTGSSWHTS
jgi:hypothetical protein